MADIDLGQGARAPRSRDAAPRIGPRHRGDRPRHPRVGARASASARWSTIASPTHRGRRGDPPPPLRAEVVGFRGDEVVLMPLGEAAGIGPDSLVTPTGRPFSIAVSDGLLGRVLDGLGRPIDGGGPDRRARATGPSIAPRPIRCRAPRVSRPLPLGVRVLDGAADRRRGAARRPLRRLGRRQVDAAGADRAPDRGRRERDRAGRRARPRGGRVPRGVAGRGGTGALGRRLRDQRRAQPGAPQGRPSSPPPSPSTSATRAGACCSCSTRSRASRAPSARSAWPPASRPRARAIRPACSRCCRGCSSGPATNARGSITALYTVLVAGGDMEEPIADEVRGILDGHVVLSRDIAARNQWPAVDVLPSLSRLMNAVADARAPRRRRSACASCWRPTSASAI